MPAFIDLPASNFPPYKFPHPWEHVAEAVRERKMPLRPRSAARAAAAWRSVRENLAARMSRSAHRRVRRRAHARGALQVWNRYPSPQCFKERLQKDVINKRLSPNQEEAVIERMVTYNYSEKVCIYTYVYTHAYMYIYIRIHTHTHTHTHTCVCDTHAYTHTH
jgi:hypothetical protein